MQIDRLQQLIDNKLNHLERTELMNELKVNPEMKQQLAVLLKVKEIGREEKRVVINLTKNKSKQTPIAKFSLSEIRRAAFGQNQANDELTNLPIKDQTLDEFLNDDI